MVRHVFASIVMLGFLAACGDAAVVAPAAAPAPVVEGPAQVGPQDFQPCKDVSECRGEPPRVVGPCPSGAQHREKWQCMHDRCVAVAVCE